LAKIDEYLKEKSAGKIVVELPNIPLLLSTKTNLAYVSTQSARSLRSSGFGETGVGSRHGRLAHSPHSKT
jgi:hypothetical protein